VLFYQYIEGLLRAGFKVHHLLIPKSKTDDEEEVARYRAQISPVGSITIESAQCSNPIQRRFGGFRFDHKSLAEPLQRASDFRADVFLGLDFLSYWAAEPLNFPFRMAWLGDLNFQTQWFHALCQAKEQPVEVFRIPSAWKRARYWRETYRQVLKTADKVIVSSGSSVAQLQALEIQSSYHPYPWPHSPEKSMEAESTSQKEEPTFLFCGGLNALGAKSALLFILKQLHPRLLRIWGEQSFRIIIAGRGSPSGWARAAMADCKEIDFRGFVEDLDLVMAECHALIVPIDIPVGNRSRIVTALAKGWLVIAHRFTQAGNPDLKDGENCYLAEDAHSFAQRMRMAYEDSDAVARVRSNAITCYRENFLPERAVARLIEEFPTPSD
jgi:glycosyltransferase involved in cell wall biosynthesis